MCLHNWRSASLFHTVVITVHSAEDTIGGAASGTATCLTLQMGVRHGIARVGTWRTLCYGTRYYARIGSTCLQL
eukprot:m.975504 g.975504  ORF g.975504 m.975504 type:complete len:74 (+) comp23941_c0_seq2:2756-2977(+)